MMQHFCTSDHKSAASAVEVTPGTASRKSRDIQRIVPFSTKKLQAVMMSLQGENYAYSLKA